MEDTRDPEAGEAGRLLRLCARAGCFSLGAVYILIGTWAQLALLRLARPAADEERILQRLREYPGGTVLILCICAGLLGYIAWRLYEAVRDPYRQDGGRAGWLDRTTTALGALAYGFIVISALKVLAGHGGHGEESQRDLARQAMAWPGGRWLMGMLGLAIVAVGIYQLAYVAGGGHRLRIRMDRLRLPARLLAELLACAGFASRAVILWVLGGCVAKAAWTSDPGAVRDTDSAFDFLGSVHHQVFAAVAVGTIAYGTFLWLNGASFRFGQDPAARARPDALRPKTGIAAARKAPGRQRKRGPRARPQGAT